MNITIAVAAKDDLNIDHFKKSIKGLNEDHGTNYRTEDSIVDKVLYSVHVKCDTECLKSMELIFLVAGVLSIHRGNQEWSRGFDSGYASASKVAADKIEMI